MSKRRVREIPANNTKGFIMRDLFGDGEPIFRVYNKKNKKKFTDYRITAEEIEVVIKDKWVAFKGEDLDWNEKALGKS